jgi:hypothetical protein
MSQPQAPGGENPPVDGGSSVEGEPRPLTVGDIRAAIANIPDETPVCIEVAYSLEEADEGVQALLRHASIETGHDGQEGVQLLYLWGSSVIDEDEQEPAGAPQGGSGGPAPSGHPGEAGPEDG